MIFFDWVVDCGESVKYFGKKAHDVREAHDAEEHYNTHHKSFATGYRMIITKTNRTQCGKTKISHYNDFIFYRSLVKMKFYEEAAFIRILASKSNNFNDLK